MDKLDAAKKLAKFAHRGQKTKAGTDYYKYHLYPVMEITNKRIVWDDHYHAEVLIAALLHDAIEDTFVTHEYLVEYFGQFVADVVKAVSRIEANTIHGEQLHKETYADFIERIATMEGHVGRAAREVKIADIIHHLQDTSAISDSLVERYTKAAIRLGFVK